MPKNFLKIIFIFLIFFKNVSAENVNNIIVKGNERIDSNTIILFSKIKIGDNLDANSLNDITKRIYNTNFFGPNFVIFCVITKIYYIIIN